MTLKFICMDKACTEKEGAVFRMEIPLEAVMDEKNIAALFCRRCCTELSIEQPCHQGRTICLRAG